MQTPFVRQNTPHPRELKAKAHKLFSKGQNSLEESDLQPEPVAEAINQNLVTDQEIVIKLQDETGNGQDESSDPSVEDDIDDVSVISLFSFLLPSFSFTSRLPVSSELRYVTCIRYFVVRLNLVLITMQLVKIHT